MVSAQQGICSAINFLCYIRFAPLWILALLGLAFFALRSVLFPSPAPAPARPRSARKPNTRSLKE
jgi:hypothetical protein